MTRSRTTILAAGGALALALAASADTFTETFDEGSNTGGWTYGAPNETIRSTGGNPGAYLHASGLDTFAPRPRTAWGVDSVFTGDYQARNVTSVGIDLTLFHVDFSAEGRPLTVMLVSDNGTPNDFGDDYAAYHIGDDLVPLEGEGWKRFTFDIPSQADSLPQGWQWILFGPDSPANPQWSDVITDVDQLRYFYGDPELFFIFQMWELGLDNPTITWQPSAAAELTDVEVTTGAILEGGLDDLRASDESYLRTRSGFGRTFVDAHNMTMIVGAATTVDSPGTIDLTIESRIDEPAGTARVSLRNWNTGEFEQVDSYPIGAAEESVLIADIDATNFVDAGGEIDVQIKHIVFAPFLAFTFESFIDEVRLDVE